jgi:hypothetical protein
LHIVDTGGADIPSRNGSLKLEARAAGIISGGAEAAFAWVVIIS